MTILEDAMGKRARPGPECLFSRLRRTNPQLHAELLEALDQAPHVVEFSEIRRQLLARGVEISKDTISRHKYGECATCRS